jgi:hypothetical protein
MEPGKEGQSLHQFYKQFKPLKSEIIRLEQKLEANRAERRTLESALEAKNDVEELLEGLRTGSTQADPGKSYVACHFAKQITDDDITKSKKYALFGICPDCKKNHPVLMSYEQVYDSPEGDKWQKKAFIICPSTLTITVYEIITKDQRF